MEPEFFSYLYYFEVPSVWSEVRDISVVFATLVIC